MKVAVVIPAYNRRDLLLRAMRSLEAQTRPPDEVVIVDDASEEDMSGCRETAKRCGFRWIRMVENRGPASARNAGVRETSAQWISFLDSDDEWEAAKLEKQLQWHEENPLLPVSQVHERWIRNGHAVPKPAHWMQKGGDLFAASVARCAIGPSCVMISRGFWDRLGGFHELFRVCEDYELWLRATAVTRIGLVGEVPLVRKHGGHGDQLSEMIPAMDRYRVHALILLTAREDLDAERRATVLRGIGEKARILVGGAEKRGLSERADFYRQLASVPWFDLGEAERTVWLEHSARFLKA